VINVLFACCKTSENDCTVAGLSGLCPRPTAPASACGWSGPLSCAVGLARERRCDFGDRAPSRRDSRLGFWPPRSIAQSIIIYYFYETYLKYSFRPNKQTNKQIFKQSNNQKESFGSRFFFFFQTSFFRKRRKEMVEERLMKERKTSRERERMRERERERES